MADILSFEDSEFIVIDTIDFEEEVQRPENSRFFTLDDQLLDYFEKALPTTKEVTKFEKKKIASEIDRLRTLYTTKIIVTDTEYKVNTIRKPIRLPWVTPIYSDFTYDPYSFQVSWLPLYEGDQKSVPNYYPRMLAALPKPYKSTKGIPLEFSSVLVDQEGKNDIVGLGTYERTKTVIHEDGSVTINKIPVANTIDEIKLKGYFISNRGVEIPNPLAEHDFLNSVNPHAYITSNVLDEVFPSVEAILTHGVPTTSDPYIEGEKYLKVYDVKLSEIPWNLWQQKFPPVESAELTKALSVKFPDRKEDVPSESLLKTYTQWSSGNYPRRWLMTQEDGGVLVIKMLMSEVGKAGNVPPAIPVEKPKPSFPESTPAECFDNSSFDKFISSGIYRPAYYADVDKALKSKKALPPNFCIPTTFIQQERADLLKGDKVAWKETSGSDMLVEYQKLMKLFLYTDVPTPPIPYEKFVGKPESSMRPNIRAILTNEMRTSEDKVDAIKQVVADLQLQDKIYVDSGGSFVICSHTLADLQGEMSDRLKYYNDWTAVVDGFRVCKFCGEQINTDVVTFQDEFDENGIPIISHDSLGGHGSSTNISIKELSSKFNLKNVGELVMYLLLSLLQIVPSIHQLVPIIDQIKKLTSALQKNAKIPIDKKHELEGMSGIIGVTLLLLTHEPFLIPKRSFGLKMKLSGFPREEGDAHVVDFLLGVLKKTIEATPNTYQGSVSTLFQSIIAKTKSVKAEILKLIPTFITPFKDVLQSSKSRYEGVPEEESLNRISMPLILISKSVFKPSEKLGAEEFMSECKNPAPHCFITGSKLPILVQSAVILDKTNPSKNSSLIPKPDFRSRSVFIEDKEIARLVKLGFPNMKLDKLKEFVKTSDGLANLALVSQLLILMPKSKFVEERLSLVTFLQSSDPSLLRDASLGILYEVLHEINKSKELVQIVANALNTNLSLTMILYTKSQAEKETMELRAKERDLLKFRLRQMDDTQREITKMLLELGFGEIVGKGDREIFAREYNVDIDRPEEGYNATRDYDDDDVPVQNGVEMTVDAGDYGDRAVRDNGDYANHGNVDDGEGFGF